MLFSRILAFLFILSALFMAASGGTDGSAALTGAQEAVKFCIGISGSICLWSAVMELMERCGITHMLQGLLRPLLRRLFPESARHEDILSAVTENVSANLLGLGNAATPAGIRAAQGMARLSPGGAAADELCVFAVLNTASLELLPATVAAVRAECGAVAPFDILPAVWFSSAVSVCAGLAAAALFRRLWP